MGAKARGMPVIGSEVLQELKRLTDWEIIGRELSKGFYLDTFVHAVGFINDVAKIANEMQHHPDILLSEFSTVRLFIKTNELGKVSARDVEFAKSIEKTWKSRWKRYEKSTW